MTDAQLETLALVVSGPACIPVRSWRTVSVLLRLGYIRPSSKLEPREAHEITDLGRAVYDGAMRAGRG